MEVPGCVGHSTDGADGFSKYSKRGTIIGKPLWLQCIYRTSSAKALRFVLMAEFEKIGPGKQLTKTTGES